jgi:membrane protease subunit HflK
MLTADINLVIVTWDVQYTISDLTKYIFEIRNVPATIRDVSVAVMKKFVGDYSVDEVMVTQREKIQTQVRDEIQEILDGMGAGVAIDQVNLDRTDPPDAVKAAFNRVNQARQVRERLINEAKGEFNEKIPAAEGKKKRLVSEARGYKADRENRALGDAKAFLNVLEEYRKAKDITRRRLYLESMAASLPQVSELLLVEGEGSSLLKLLDIKKQGGLGK